MADKKRGLGRGLSALIGDVDIGCRQMPKCPQEKSNKPPTPSSEGLLSGAS